MCFHHDEYPWRIMLDKKDVCCFLYCYISMSTSCFLQIVTISNAFVGQIFFSTVFVCKMVPRHKTCRYCKFVWNPSDYLQSMCNCILLATLFVSSFTCGIIMCPSHLLTRNMYFCVLIFFIKKVQCSIPIAKRFVFGKVLHIMCK